MVIAKIKMFSGFCLLLLLCSVRAAALPDFLDFVNVRGEFLPLAITAPPKQALAFKTAYRGSPAGNIKVSVESDEKSLFVMFQKERGGAYPFASRGNVIIVRDAVKGFIQRVIWFLSDDGLSFISLYPKNESTFADYIVAGSVIKSQQRISALIYNIFTRSLENLYGITRHSFDWQLACPDYDAAMNPKAAELVKDLQTLAGDSHAMQTKIKTVLQSHPAKGEVNEIPYRQSADFTEPRNPAIVTTQPWTETKGLALNALGGILIANIQSDCVYTAMVGRSDKTYKLFIAPVVNESGGYTFYTVDEQHGEVVELSDILAEMKGASLRLFKINLTPPDEFEE